MIGQVAPGITISLVSEERRYIFIRFIINLDFNGMPHLPGQVDTTLIR